MITSKLLIKTIVLSLAISSPINANEVIRGLHISGEAFDVKNQKFLYREQHLIDDKTHTVSYSNNDGNIFAEKKLSYEISFLTPVYQLHDQRFSRESGSVLKNNQWFMYRNEKSGSRNELQLNNQESLVIDAGFNNFVRLHFDELDAGTLLHFSFGLTDPLTDLPMHIQRIDCRSYQPDQESKKNLCLRAITSNVLYRWFVPTIYAVYDRDTRFLMRYEGPSNLPGNNDSAQTVRINYLYSSNPTGVIPTGNPQ